MVSATLIITVSVAEKVISVTTHSLPIFVLISCLMLFYCRHLAHFARQQLHPEHDISSYYCLALE